MSDQYVLDKAEEVTVQKALQPITKIVLIVGENGSEQVVYEAGDDTGRTLEVTNPFGTQAIADALLAKLGGYVYYPYSADNAVINPLSELGDAVYVGGIKSVLASKITTYDALSLSDIGAPAEAAVDHEYPYTVKPNRNITRRIATVETSLQLNIDSIEASVIDHGNQLSQTVRLAANGITITNASGSALTIDGGQLIANSVSATAIKTSELVVGGNISVQSGAIVFSDLDASTQAAINAGVTAGEVRTIITDELVSSPTIAGGTFMNLAQSCYLKMLHNTSWDDQIRMILSTNTQGDSTPYFEILGYTSSIGTYGSGVAFQTFGDRFLSVIKKTGDFPYVNITAGELNLYGTLFFHDAYGSSLPASGSEGQVFFKVS